MPAVLRRISFLLLCLLPCLAALAGCGGSGLGLPGLALRPAASGQAAFTVKWPDQPSPSLSSSRLGSRLIPVAAASLVFTIKRGGAVIATRTLARPASALTVSALPVGALTVTAAAYPTAAGTGVVQASATAPLTITSGQTTPLTLTLADTVSSLKVYSAAQILPLSGTLSLIATAFNAANEIIITGGSIGWSSSNPAVATVNAAGIVTGIGAGSAVITATDSESGASGSFNAVPSAPSPHGSTPAVIPGTVEAEDYDLGGPGVGYFSSSSSNAGGYYRNDGVNIYNLAGASNAAYVGGTQAGNWLRYTVAVSSASFYEISFRVRNPGAGASFHLEDAAGSNLTGPLSVPNTGGGSGFVTVAAGVSLPAGIQTLRLMLDTGASPGGSVGDFDSFLFSPSLTTGGTPTASSYPVDSQKADRAFDGSVSTKWLANMTASGAWLQYQFGSGQAFTVSKYQLISADDSPGRDPKDWTLSGSNDGTTWTTLDTRSGETFTARYQAKTYTPSSSGVYAYYRLNITANNGSTESTYGGTGLIQLSELGLYGS